VWRSNEVTVINDDAAKIVMVKDIQKTLKGIRQRLQSLA